MYKLYFQGDFALQFISLLKRSMIMNNFKFLRKKIIFTLCVIVLYRIGSHIPLPTVDSTKIASMMQIAKSGVFGMFNTFSGGAMSRASIFVLGIMPYITASIIMQLLVVSYPALKKLKKDGGEQGARKISMYTKYLTILIAFAQGYSVASGLISMDVMKAGSGIVNAKLFSAFIIVVSTLIIMWLGDQITSHGIGNGSSIIIFSGIVAEAPKDMAGVFTSIKNGSMSGLDGVALIGIFILTCIMVVFCERVYRMIYIQYPRQNYHQFMNHKAGQNEQQNFIPLRLNTAGLIPPIFASAILLLPTTIMTFLPHNGDGTMQWIVTNLAHGRPLFIIMDIVLIMLFSYFYNTSIFDTEELVSGLRRSGAFIPGIRPGEQTAQYLSKTLKNISIIGGIYISSVCAVPELLSDKYGYSFLLGGTGLLIVCSVVNDVVTQIQTHNMSSKYEKVMRKYNKKR